MQQAERVPVEATLHICFNNYNNDLAQDIAYDYANKLTCAISGKKHELIHGRILKIAEQEDINQTAQYEYQVRFGFQVKEAVFNDNLQSPVNPTVTIIPSLNIEKEGVGFWLIEDDFVIS
jgi:hypothetical protein